MKCYDKDTKSLKRNKTKQTIPALMAAPAPHPKLYALPLEYKDSFKNLIATLIDIFKAIKPTKATTINP